MRTRSRRMRTASRRLASRVGSSLPIRRRHRRSWQGGRRSRPYGFRCRRGIVSSPCRRCPRVWSPSSSATVRPACWCEPVLRAVGAADGARGRDARTIRSFPPGCRRSTIRSLERSWRHAHRDGADPGAGGRRERAGARRGLGARRVGGAERRGRARPRAAAAIGRLRLAQRRSGPPHRPRRALRRRAPAGAPRRAGTARGRHRSGVRARLD